MVVCPEHTPSWLRGLPIELRRWPRASRLWRGKFDRLSQPHLFLLTDTVRPQPQQQPPPSFEQEEKKKPRKLEMRLEKASQDHVAFSAPFLDNTLQKMLMLQNRMLKTTADLSKADGVEEKVIKEHASQSAELSRIIAMICAEKARQGA